MSEHIRSIQSQDIEQVLAVFGQELGEGYVSREDLIGSEGESPVVFVAISDTGSVVGAATGYIVDSISSIVPSNQDHTVSSLVNVPAQARIGVLKSVSVVSDMSGQGFGSAVSEAVTEALIQRGADYVASIGWTDHDGCHIEGPLVRLGYAQCGEVKDFWLAESVEQGYSCPSCGNPCKCSAQIFLKTVAAI